MGNLLDSFKKIYNYFKNPIGFLTLVFLFFLTSLTLFQIIFFKYYLDNSLKSKVENTFNQIENKLSDYIKFLENFYKIPFIPEFAELPESKGWLLELVESLEELFKREKLINLAIFYQKDLFLSWNYKSKELPFKDCQSKYEKENNILKILKNTTIENKKYCIFLTLDISYYQKTFYRYLFIVLILYFLTLVMIFYLFSRLQMAEEKKKDAERRLQAERELALLGKMAATLAHELRNNLNNLFLLLQRSTQNEVSQNKIIEELKGLLEWSQDILLFHKDIKINPQYFHPDLLIYELKLLISTLPNKNIDFQVDNRIELLWGDPFWIKKAIENLIKNSIQILNKGGIIKLTLKEENNKFIIEVYDNGPPISEDIKSHIFEPFFTTKKEGFGLGLYLVKKIIEAHHGKVTIENFTDCGKIFRLVWMPYEKR